jgi:Permuted papain-like amidase enzyme, YaeF/YiiX, C92 family
MRRYIVSSISSFIAFIQFYTLDAQAAESVRTSARDLAEKLEIGDVVFIHVPTLLFKKVAAATESWANHVGIVTGRSGDDVIVAESRIPFSGATTLSRYLARSEGGRFEIRRLNTPLTEQQRKGVQAAALKREGILYDLGFNLHSHRQFCSRFTYEVLQEATGVKTGDVETFATLLAHNPKAGLAFWRVWYLGRIPWQRETVTPASMLNSPNLHTVLVGYAWN